MSDLQTVYDEFHQAILDRLPVGLGEGGANSSIVAFEIGTPIPEDAFKLDDGSAHAVLAIEYLANRADTVPKIEEGLFNRSLRTVEGQYELLLKGSRTENAALFELFEQQKSKASFSFGEPTSPILGLPFREIVASPSNWFDPSVSENWTEITIGRTDESVVHGTEPRHPQISINPKLTAWQVASSTIQPILTQPVSRRSLEKILVTGGALESVSSLPIETLRPSLQFERIVPSAAEPSSTPYFGAYVTTRAPFRGTIEREAQPARPIKSVRRGTGLQAFKFDMISTELLKDVLAATAAEQEVGANAFSMRFSMCVVHIARPWLSGDFLSFPDWYVQGLEKGSASSGTSDTQGTFSFVPTACVLVRDLKIKAKWSEKDRDIITKSQSLGGFSLLGRSFEQQNLSLEVPGMQSVAWICERLPVLPPGAPPPT
jgi:hypothetical protein